MKNAIIKVNDLRKDYQVGEMTVHALRGVHMEIYEGDFTAIMGASGSGKSTMLNILGCLDVPTQGEYLLDSVNMGKLNKNQLAGLRNNKLGFIFQSYNLLPRTTALENVELPLYYNSKVKSKERRERAIHALEQVGLADRMDHMPNQLSGGQQQRVAIARALANDPALIIADEPTGRLDSGTAETIFQIFENLVAQGKTVFMVTHDIQFAKRSTRTLEISDGQFVS